MSGVEGFVFQQIVNMNWDQAIYTASPNNTINVAQFAAKGSGTNIGIALTPKGTGFISAQVPDGTVAGGNARGENAVDLQTFRTDATQVASGQCSFVAGLGCKASATRAVAIGDRNSASNSYAIALGFFCGSSGDTSVAIGKQCTASANTAIAMGGQSSATGEASVAIGSLCTASGVSSFASGNRGESYLRGARSHGGFAIAEVGATQEICLPLGGKTTTNAEVILGLEAATKPILKANRAWSGILHVTGVKSDGSAIAVYHRQVAIKRSGNTTTMEKNEVIGVDTAAGTSINITADDTNEALSVGVTGVLSETWRWVAVFHGAELAIGA